MQYIYRRLIDQKALLINNKWKGWGKPCTVESTYKVLLLVCVICNSIFSFILFGYCMGFF